MSNFGDKRRAEAQHVADLDHREQIEGEVVSAIRKEFGVMELSIELMEAIRDGKIKHVKIEY